MKHFKKTILLLALFFGAFTEISTLNAQSNPIPDKRITEAFGKEYVDFLLKNNPSLINYYNLYLNKAWKFIELPSDKSNGIPKLELLPQYKNTKKSDFNILLYKVTRYYNRENFYIYNGKIIVLLSEKDFMDLYNQSKNNQQ